MLLRVTGPMASLTRMLRLQLMSAWAFHQTLVANTPLKGRRDSTLGSSRTSCVIPPSDSGVSRSCGGRADASASGCSTVPENPVDASKELRRW